MMAVFSDEAYPIEHHVNHLAAHTEVATSEVIG